MNPSHPTSVFALIFYSIQFLLGIPGNLMIIVVYGKKKRKISTDILIISQGIIDFAAALLAPVNILKSIADRFTTRVICRIALFGNNSLAFASLFLTAAIAVDRYFIVCRPFNKKSSNRRALAFATICSVLGGSLTCTKLIFVEGYESDQGQKTCLVVDTYHILDTLEAWLKTSGFVLALVVSSAMYGKIYCTIRKQVKIHAQLVSGASRLNYESGQSSNGTTLRDTKVGVTETQVTRSDLNQTSEDSPAVPGNPKESSAGAEHGSSSPSYLQTTAEVLDQDLTSLTNAGENKSHLATASVCVRPRHKVTDRGENRTTKMLMAVTVILLASWLPPIVFFHLRDSTLELIEQSITAETLVYIGKRLPGYNHVINFFVYALMNKRFRVDCIRLFRHSR
ncbi:neuropeptides B/W receptor type 1-like [Diadema antillarum]|uniref:neuropeptides B/W receptor type 1-like n=1 Tax=Diadema antillarum TaxID=105358 RepID=UPI003A8B99D2